MLYHVVQGNGQDTWQMILPDSLNNKVLRAVHDNMDHKAVEKTTLLMRITCYWLRMASNIANYCQKCNLAKAGKKLCPTMSSLTASRALEILGIDFTVLDRSTGGIENILFLSLCFYEIHTSCSHKRQPL